jgi:hypothetical protein
VFLVAFSMTAFIFCGDISSFAFRIHGLVDLRRLICNLGKIGELG